MGEENGKMESSSDRWENIKPLNMCKRQQIYCWSRRREDKLFEGQKGQNSPNLKNAMNSKIPETQ